MRMFFHRLWAVVTLAAGSVGLFQVLGIPDTQLALAWACGTAIGSGGSALLLSFIKPKVQE